MSKEFYIGINNIARKIKKAYIGVDGEARKIKKIYIGVDSVAQLFYESAPEAYQLTARSWNGTMGSTKVFINDVETLSIPLSTSSSQAGVTTTVMAGDKVTVRLTAKGSNPLTETNSNNSTTLPYWSPDTLEWFQDTNAIYDGYVAYSFYMPKSNVDFYLKYASVIAG